MQVDLRSPRVDLRHAGVPERAWSAPLRALPAANPATLAHERARLVVVAPHPDDETLGTGGIIAALATDSVPVLVVSVTDGEAAPVGCDRLAAVRRGELREALHRLAPAATVGRLALPDGEVAGREDELVDRLGEVFAASDVVLAPHPSDGHPDHDACGRAAVAAARRVGARCWTYPVWAWHWHDPAASELARDGVRIVLPLAAWEAKQSAIGCYRSQLAGHAPVVPAFAMPRYRRPFEVVVPA
jgi:LmbE family N-acetylglucosaminyl deacetylase